jgi:hypothetical protein
VLRLNRRWGVDGVRRLVGGGGTTAGGTRRVEVQRVVCITITAGDAGCCKAVGCFVGRHILERLQE